MTVCIGVVCDRSKSIVCVSDQKIDFGEFAADTKTEKNELFAIDCVVLYAGNDAELAPFVFEFARSKLRDKVWTPAIAAECLHLGYHECRHREIESKVLTRYGFTVDSFQKNGKKLLTPEVFTSLCQQIVKVRISLEFLICGFEKHRKARLYRPQLFSTGLLPPQNHTALGMWAIGAGRYLALSSLAFAADKRKLSSQSSFGIGVYSALEAKFMAESNGLVGRKTNVLVVSPSRLRVLDDRGVETIREKWRTQGAPKLPEGVKHIPRYFGSIVQRKRQNILD